MSTETYHLLFTNLLHTQAYTDATVFLQISSSMLCRL